MKEELRYFEAFIKNKMLTYLVEYILTHLVKSLEEENTLKKNDVNKKKPIVIDKKYIIKKNIVNFYSQENKHKTAQENKHKTSKETILSIISYKQPFRLITEDDVNNFDILTITYIINNFKVTTGCKIQIEKFIKALWTKIASGKIEPDQFLRQALYGQNCFTNFLNNTIVENIIKNYEIPIKFHNLALRNLALRNLALPNLALRILKIGVDDNPEFTDKDLDGLVTLMGNQKFFGLLTEEKIKLILDGYENAENKDLNKDSYKKHKDLDKKLYKEMKELYKKKKKKQKELYKKRAESYKVKLSKAIILNKNKKDLRRILSITKIKECIEDGFFGKETFGFVLEETFISKMFEIENNEFLKEFIENNKISKVKGSNFFKIVFNNEEFKKKIKDYYACEEKHISCMQKIMYLSDAKNFEEKFDKKPDKFFKENESDLLEVLKNKLFINNLRHVDVCNILRYVGNFQKKNIENLFGNEVFCNKVNEGVQKDEDGKSIQYKFFFHKTFKSDDDNEIIKHLKKLMCEYKNKDVIYLPVKKNGEYFLCYLDEERNLIQVEIKKILSPQKYQKFNGSILTNEDQKPFHDHIEDNLFPPLPADVVDNMLADERFDTVWQKHLIGGKFGKIWRRMVLRYMEKNALPKLKDNEEKYKKVQQECRGLRNLSDKQRVFFTWPLIPIKIIGSAINYIALGGIYPAQFGAKYVEYKEDDKQLQNFSTDKYLVRKKDYIRNNFLDAGTITLKGIQISSNGQSSGKEECHIFYIPGNGDSLFNGTDTAIEDINLGENADDFPLNITAHMVNPRGVDMKGYLSKGFYSDHIINDYVNIIISEIDNSVGKENSYKFVVKGQSLGSGLATQVVYKLHQKGYKVMLVNGRSFGTAASVITRISTKKPGFFQKIFQGLCQKVVDLGAGIIRWKLDSAKYYERIPEEYKTYFTAVDDGVINYYASLHYARKNKRKIFKEALLDLQGKVKNADVRKEDCSINDLFKKCSKKTQSFKKDILNLYVMYNPEILSEPCVNVDSKDKIINGFEKIKVTQDNKNQIIKGLEIIRYLLTTGRKFSRTLGYETEDAHNVSLEALRPKYFKNAEGEPHKDQEESSSIKYKVGNLEEFKNKYANAFVIDEISKRIRFHNLSQKKPGDTTEQMRNALSRDGGGEGKKTIDIIKIESSSTEVKKKLVSTGETTNKAKQAPKKSHSSCLSNLLYHGFGACKEIANNALEWLGDISKYHFAKCWFDGEKDFNKSRNRRPM